MRNRLLTAVLLSILGTTSLSAAKPEPPKPARSPQELQQQLEAILKDTRTSGVSLAIVHRDGPEWIAGLGTADVATGREATPQTLFRIGSVSKAFASLSILKLAREGRLRLDDPIRKLVPEVGFDNRWESSDPVRVVHLLEHTTGWDDMHLREYAKDARNMSLGEGLEYGRASRFCRWRPGTRMAYCNTGPAVAAFIVEKVTGQRFEDYVEQSLFIPIGMKTATYFQPADALGATTLYHPDGTTPYRYWHVIYRPAGSINASAQDMAAYVQLYLNRGAVNGAPVVDAADIDRMESPTSTWAAREGLQNGYGLSNYWRTYEGCVWHGHDGGVDGGLTQLAYLGEHGVGYFFSINSGNGDAFERIGRAIRAYVTLKLPRPAVPPAAALTADAAAWSGWYRPDSSRMSLTTFLERLAGISWVHFVDGKMLLTAMNGTEIFVPVSGRLFRHVPKDGPPEPAASAALLTPNGDGRFIQATMNLTFKRIPTALAGVEIALAVFVALSILSVLAYAPVWMIGGLIKRRRRPAERWMRLWPLLAVGSLIAFVGIFIVCSDDLITRMGIVTPWSLAAWLVSIAFAAASLASAWKAWRAPVTDVRRTVRVYSAIVATALLIATAYLAWWGIIGLRTWA